MSGWLVLIAQNAALAIVLALCVALLTRVWRNPPMAHLLWVLVLVRLVAPPLLPVEWPVWDAATGSSDLGKVTMPPAATPAAASQETGASGHVAGQSLSPDVAASSTAQHEVAVDSAFEMPRLALPVLLALWLGGAVCCGAVAVTRIVRFERRLRGALPASDRVQALARDVAVRLGVRRVPRVCYATEVEVPFLWWAGGRAAIVLPTRLLGALDEEGTSLILAHELAHLRRRDHWVRVFELVVTAIHWWNPLAWLVRRRIHEIEDLCCDAWVRTVFPLRTRRYGEVLLWAVESLTLSKTSVRLLPASPFLQTTSLKRRIEMMLASQFAPCVAKKSLLVVGLFALAVLPAFVPVSVTEAKEEGTATDGKGEAVPPAKPAAQATSEFPHVVKFEQGATRFAEGDSITILEVRGTADKFTPGNLYWIRGRYVLNSRDRAMMAAYTTARHRRDGTSSPLTVQSTVVKKGEGEFTLYLPMLCEGWPHVSFYPADHGDGFGGNYFGTGDSVLRKWWDTKPEKTTATIDRGVQWLEQAQREHMIRQWRIGEQFLISPSGRY